MQQPTSPQQQMSRMLTGYWITQPISVAAKLGIADLLTDGAQTVEWLAESTGAHAPSLYRLLRALASLGIFVEHDRHQFSLTSLADCLRRDVPGSQRAMAILVGEEHYRAWGDLLHSIQTGRCAFEQVYGMPFFEYLSQNPSQEGTFDDAMASEYGREMEPLLEAYDFAQIGTLADIGGGKGVVLSSVLKEFPQMQCILFDRQEVVEQAEKIMAAADVADRCRLVAGNFFESVPKGADAYMMRHVIHDWEDQQAVKILTNCRDALSAGGKVLIAESVIPLGNAPFYGKLVDLTMLVIPGGKERTEEEYNALLTSAGLRLTGITPTRTEISLIEAERA